MTEMAYQLYVTISQVTAWASEPLQQALGSQRIPALSALLLGLLGGLAPCQVTANAGAIAYVTQASQQRLPLWHAVRDFVAGKAAVYLLLGLLAALLGFQLPIPVMAFVRKLSGPLMLLVGLYLLGVLRWRGTGGERVTEWLQAHAPKRGSPPFWLGAAFSLGFCPTMAVIFFGALVPLIIQAELGIVLPLIFAVGTAVPVILWAVALSAGRGAASRWIRRLRSTDRYVRVFAAIIFLVLGLGDTLIYWLM